MILEYKTFNNYVQLGYESLKKNLTEIDFLVT